jgi:hypothetical protein
MLPYLVTKKYFVKSVGKPENQAAGDREDADLPVNSESIK